MDEIPRSGSDCDVPQSLPPEFVEVSLDVTVYTLAANV